VFHFLLAEVKVNVCHVAAEIYKMIKKTIPNKNVPYLGKTAYSNSYLRQDERETACFAIKQPSKQ